jgi:hypothetical protein
MNQDLHTVALGDLIRSMAMAVADAQAGLDRSSFLMAEMMTGEYPLRDLATGNIVDALGKPTTTPELIKSRVQFGFSIDKDGNRVPNMVSMMELGFTPNFYQFVDTVIEVRLTLQVEKSETKVDPLTGERVLEAGRRDDFRLKSQPLNAAQTSAYNYKLEFASVFKTKIVCVPPPAALEERIREVLRQEALAALPSSTTP